MEAVSLQVMVKDQGRDKITQGVKEYMNQGHPTIRGGLRGSYGEKIRHERGRDNRVVAQLLGEKWLQGLANRVQQYGETKNPTRPLLQLKKLRPRKAD